MKNKNSTTTMEQYITQTIRKSKPETVEELINLVKLKYPTTEQEILEQILKLHSDGKLALKEQTNPFPTTLKGYLSYRAYWYWTIIMLAAATTILVFTIPEEAYPIVYVRYLLGSIFVLWLPGYSLIKALFPTKELDNIEQLALSIGMSLALVPITGLLLNYTPWGIRATPVTLALLTLTATFATVAVIREHQAQLRGKLTETRTTAGL